MINSTKVAAIVPAFNEEKTVGNVLKVLLASKELDEVILVDDGSTDKTAEVGQNLGVKIIRLEKNQGKGNAMKQGVNATDARIIVFFDADLLGLSAQHVALLLKPFEKNNTGMCVGIRERLLGLPKVIAKIDPLLAIGGERAMKKEIFQALPEKLIQGFSIETTLNYYCLKRGISIKYVLLNGLDMVSKEKKWSFKKGFSRRVKMIYEMLRIRLILIFNKNDFV